MNTEQWTTSRLLSTAARLNGTFQNERLSDLAVSQAGATTLRALSDSGPISQSGLADLVQVQAQTMGKVLEKLELKGFVSRVRDTWDKRRVRTCITTQGNDVLRSIDQLPGTAPAGPSEVQLRNALIAIITALEAPRS